MSINTAMAAGVSGLSANEAAVTAISNNIANSNTVGYKQTDVSFESFVTAATAGGGAAALNTGGGVTATAADLVTQQGQLTQTASNTDLAINGAGFFVVSKTPTTGGVVNAVANSNPTLFTRAGSFTEDKNGNLVNSAGDYLQGWLADASGNITTTTTNVSALSTINVLTAGGAVSPTTQVAINANVNAATTVNAAVTGGTYSATSATTSMAAYIASSGTTGTKPDFTITVPVSDSLGGQHTLEIALLKTTTPDQWDAEVVDPTSGDVAGVTNGQLANGTLSFTSSGVYNPATSTLLGGGSPLSMTIGASGGAAPAWATALGAASQTISLNLSNVTQESSTSATQSITTNGTSFGNLSSVTVDAKGIVTANYDNGVSRNIAQVAVATFSDPDGLAAVSGDAYQQTLASGNYSILQAGTGGAGVIDPQTLEASTVDLSSQFTNLIVTQRAYAACSKVITSADTMVQQLLDIIR